jgi:16S rRNA (guanine527-N7)-methyltransferase
VCFTVKKNVKHMVAVVAELTPVAGDTVRELVHRYGLQDGPAESRLRALAAWVAADPEAPTTVVEPAAVVRDHLADSLVALELSAVREARHVADLGSGAGFPGLPLAIALPRAQVALVESNGRKCAFIDRAAAAADVDNAAVIYTRAEHWTDGQTACDLVVARALAPLPVVVEYAAPLLMSGGMLVAWRGGRDADAEARAERAAAIVGLEPASPVRVNPYPGAERRHLHPFVKVRETPDRFPRRAGIALKRPLG